MQAEGDAPNASGWRDYAEDATGFGVVEWRTARDLVIRPRAVLDAYVAGGPTGRGLYARPLRFYLALCGVLMFYLFLIGGNQRLLSDIPPPIMDPLIAWSGKDRAAFVAGAGDWLGFLSVPVLALLYTVAIAPLIKGWGGYRWRVAFRATLAMLCAATVPMLALGPLPYLDQYKAICGIIIYGCIIAAFVRMGRKVWWQSAAGAVGKSLLVVLAMATSATVGLVLLPVLAAVGVRLLG